MEEEVFSQQQLDNNEKNKEKLFKLVASGDAVLMVGAGCSASIYPDWDGFIHKLDEAAKIIDENFQGNTADFLLFANDVKACLGNDRYYTILYSEFGPKEPTHYPFHEILCSLPFRGITTTNYDTVLENALMKVLGNNDNSLHIEGVSKIKIFEFLSSLNSNSKYPKRVVHLHGRYDIPDSIILCEGEYIKKYGFTVRAQQTSLYDAIQHEGLTKEEFESLLLNYGYQWPLRRKIIWSLLATRRVVFVGFSMRDPYFEKMFEFVSDDLNPYGLDTHFLILRITKQNKISVFQFASKLKQKYGIETVFFEDDESFKGLENFILEMGNKLLPKEIEEENLEKENLEKLPESEELTELLFKINQKQIENENQ